MAANIQIDQLVRSLLQKDSIEQCSMQELEQFATRHPYFGAAQLLLSKKMQLERSEGYPEQLQKTLLSFNNPLWVRQLLGETGEALIEAAPVPEISRPVENRMKEVAEPETMIEEVPVEEKLLHTNAQPEIPAPKETDAVPQLAFEPYHTVDYFASQGIRYKPEDKPLDKFGQQLKSFTDWLKVMKRLPVTEITARTMPAAELKVEQLAQHSLEEKEVLTEAMAEVWIKQGNHDKAREIYRKLSLLDPSKNAYFAAKIEDLQK